MLTKSKIASFFQALNSQTAVVSPGSILPSSAVDAIVYVFCYFFPSQIQTLNITENYKINFQLVILLDKRAFVALALSLQCIQECLPAHKVLSSDTAH